MAYPSGGFSVNLDALSSLAKRLRVHLEMLNRQRSKLDYIERRPRLGDTAGGRHEARVHETLWALYRERLTHLCEAYGLAVDFTELILDSYQASDRQARGDILAALDRLKSATARLPGPD